MEEEVDPVKDDERDICLDEFDSHTFVFKSTLKGEAMRNFGVPAFRLSITVDGYAPTTIKLVTSEVYPT